MKLLRRSAAEAVSTESGPTPKEAKTQPTPEKLTKALAETEEKLIQLERVSFKTGVDNYTKWLEAGGHFLSEQSVFAPMDGREPKEVRKFAKAHTLAGVALEYSLAHQPRAESIIDKAYKNRATTIFIRRFPQIIDIFAETGTKGVDETDHMPIDDILRSLIVSPGDEKTKNPFIEQVEIEKSIISSLGKRTLSGSAASAKAANLHKLSSLKRHWQPRTVEAWLKTQANDFLSQEQIKVLQKSIRHQTGWIETD